MTVCNECFEDFLHPIIHELMSKNKKFDQQYGKHKRWDWDDEAVTLRFSDPDLLTLVIDVSVVGTTEGNRWQWTWANRNFDARSKLDIDKVREFGELHGYDKLTTAFVEADEYTGWAMTAVAAHVLDSPGAYRFETDNGYCYLLYRKIEVIPSGLGDVWGAMKGAITITHGVDITEPTGEVWEAEQ